MIIDYLTYVEDKNLIITKLVDEEIVHSISLKPTDYIGHFVHVVSFDDTEQVYNYITQTNNEYHYKLTQDNHVIELYKKVHYWTLSECEHRGDVQSYVHNIYCAGATIVECGILDSSKEQGYVCFTVKNYDDFIERYNELRDSNNDFWFV